MTNLEIIKNYQRIIWDVKNTNDIDNYFHDDALIHSPVETTRGLEKMKAIIAQWYLAFPDLKVHWEDFICDDNRVVARWTASGTHTGEFLSIAPTQQSIKYSGITIYELDKGKIKQYWAFVDMQGLLNQLTR